jgi:hypothetical protein
MISSGESSVPLSDEKSAQKAAISAQQHDRDAGSSTQELGGSDGKGKKENSLQLEQRETALLEQLRQIQGDLYKTHLQRRESELTLLPPDTLHAVSGEQEKQSLLIAADGSNSEETLRFEDAIRLSSAESKFLHLNVRFTGHLQKGIMHFLYDLYDRRLNEAVSTEARKDLAAKKGFATDEEMRDDAVLAIVTDLFRSYLPNQIIVFSLSHIQNRIDAVFADQNSLQERATDTSKLLQGMDILKKRLVYDIACDIIEDAAQKYLPDPLHTNHNVHKGVTAEFYAQQEIGMDFAELLYAVTDELIQKMQKEGGGEIHILNMPQIRHDCNDVINAKIMQHKLHKEIAAQSDMAGIPAVHTNKKTFDPNFLYNLRKFAAEREIMRSGGKADIHLPLPPEDVEFNKEVEVTIATPADIPFLQKFERDHFAKWREPFDRNKDNPELSTDEVKAMREFHTYGGHINVLSQERLEFIMKHGIVVKLERQITDKLRVVLGTVSALSRAPSSISQKHDEYDPLLWEHHASNPALFPQYDLKNIDFPGGFSVAEKEKLWSTAQEQLLICRSSILPSLNSETVADQLQEEKLPAALENKSLRRLGLAARGKYEIFRIAQMFGSKSVTFNIGTLKEPGDYGLRMANKPSEKHNAWMSTRYWRKYVTLLKPKFAEGPMMLWTAYFSEIDDGIRVFLQRPGGLMHEQRGFEKDRLEESVAAHYQDIKRDIEASKGITDVDEIIHAPW